MTREQAWEQIEADENAERRDDDPTYRPEWRIGRIPKPLSTNVAMLLAAIEARMHLASYDMPRELTVTFRAPNSSCRNLPGGAFATVEAYRHSRINGTNEGHGHANAMIQALALAFLSVLTPPE